MIKIAAIARNTFKEAIRNRILYVILIFALLLIGFSGILSELSIADPIKIMKSLGFSAINLFGVAIAVFVGVSLVYNELEKKTIYTIVSKPIGRWQFMLGKFFGLLMTVWVNVLVMAIFFLIALHFYQISNDPEQEIGWVMGLAKSIGLGVRDFFYWGAEGSVATNVMPVILVSLLELAIITAFAILFSSFSTPTLSMFLTVLVFVIGRLNRDIIQFADNIYRIANRTAQATGGEIELPLSYYLSLAAAHVVPNLQPFQEAVAQAIHQPTVELWPGSILYAILYTCGILSLSIMIFLHRNFK